MAREFSDDPKNIYHRGVSTGKRSCEPRLRELEAAIDEANTRARRAEHGVVGPCQECARWNRDSVTAKWGYCTPPDRITLAYDNWWGEPDKKVCTQEGFGCVRFLAKQPTKD